METPDQAFCLLALLRCPERREAILGVLPEARQDPLRREFARWSARPAEELRARLAQLAAWPELSPAPRILKRYLARR